MYAKILLLYANIRENDLEMSLFHFYYYYYALIIKYYTIYTYIYRS